MNQALDQRTQDRSVAAPSLDMIARQAALAGPSRSAGPCTLYAVDVASWMRGALRFDKSVVEVATPSELRAALQSTDVETVLVLTSPLMPFEKLLALCVQGSLPKTVFYEVTR